MANGNNTNIWIKIGHVAIPFIIGLASAGFWFGSRSASLSSNQKELLDWKAGAEPQILRMDSEGTRAGERFSLDQAKELGRLDERLKQVEKDSRQLETMKLKIETLERAVILPKGKP